MKVFWLFNHPAPYKVNFFNELGKHIELTALFERDQEGGRNAIFYSKKPENFEAVYAHAKPIGDLNSNSKFPVKYLKEHTFDIYVLNGYAQFTEMRTIRYCRRKKIPYIFYINGGVIKKESFLKKKLKSHYIKGACAYLCPDEQSKKYLVHYGVKEENITLYPYSSVYEKELVKAPLSKEEKLSLRKELGLPEGTLYVSSGFFIERKNFLQLIDVYSKLKEPSTLLLIGEGEQKTLLENRIKELGLSNVLLMDFVEHEKLLRILSCCDAFLFLSKEDIYGHVIEEAFTQALPVMSSKKVNAALHLIEDGMNGKLVDLEDEEGILKAMKEVLNPSFPEKCLEKARLNTLEEGVEHHLKYFEDFLKRIKSN